MDEDLIAFYRARLDEDEAEANATADADGEFWTDVKGDGTHFARHDPAHVLRDIYAKRVILADYEAAIDDYADFDVIRVNHLKRAVKLLAAVYSDHPDYSAAWGF